ncbi:MAG TPA: LysR family transcriptional regulator [Kofleriaceae bacterium]|nr:LysR family transcriptional regulator [Kofleriaceae bacterium]
MGEQLPPLDALRCFAEAARLLNFRAAARAVGLTPAALGQRIKQLEDQLDQRLFHRTTRSVVLTEAGLALLPLAHRALDAARDCVRQGRGELGAPPMELTLGTRHELGLSWIVPMLPRIGKDHPSLTLHLYFGSGPDLVLRVRTLDIDCAVTSTRLTDPKLDSARLHEERYAFVASPRLLARVPLKKPEHAGRHTLIDATGELPLFHYWRDAPGGIDSLAFGRVLRVGTISAIRALVVRGDGVAVLPEYFVAADLAGKKLVRLFPEVEPLTDYFRLVFRADDPRRSVYQSLARTMAEVPLR